MGKFIDLEVSRGGYTASSFSESGGLLQSLARRRREFGAVQRCPRIRRYFEANSMKDTSSSSSGGSNSQHHSRYTSFNIIKFKNSTFFPAY